MSVLGLFIILGLCVVGVHNTRMCYSCAGVHDAAACTKIHKCHGDQLCGGEKILDHGVERIDLGCYDPHKCDMTPVSIVGKRSHHGALAKCCYDNMCNGHMFSSSAPGQGALTTQASIYLNRRECLSCHEVSEPSMCHRTQICHDDEMCGSEVVTEHNGYQHFWLGCMKPHDCDHHDSHHSRCRECCSGYECNKNLCPAYHAAYTSAPTQGIKTTVRTQATTVATPKPTTTVATISTTVTTATTTAQLVNKTSTGDVVTTPVPIVHTGTVSILTSGLPCVDYTGDGFQCSSFDQFDFCRDPTSFAYSIALINCRKYCGLCTIDTVVTTGSSKIDTDGTQAPSTASPTTAKPVTNPITTTQAPTTIASTASTGTQGPSITATTFGRPCVDETAHGFQCSSYDIFNFCTDQTSFAHPLALQKCPKHCGFCN